jgi:hypothetical protein
MVPCEEIARVLFHVHFRHRPSVHHDWLPVGQRQEDHRPGRNDAGEDPHDLSQVTAFAAGRPSSGSAGLFFRTGICAYNEASVMNRDGPARMATTRIDAPSTCFPDCSGCL